LIAALLDSKRDDITQFPMCIVCEPNKPTPDDILKLDGDFV